MKRLMMILSLVAMLVVAAAPASAQRFVPFDVDNDDDEIRCFLIDDEIVCFRVDDRDRFRGFDFDGIGGPAAQEFSLEDVESGDVEPSVDISNAGDNVNLCAGILQAANSGNVQNAQGVVGYLSRIDDIEFEGSSIEISSELEQECVQTIRQAAAASGGGGGAVARIASPPEAIAGGAAPPAGGAVAGGGAAPAGGAVAGGGAAPAGGAAAKAGGGMLPKTGGIADVGPLAAAAGLLLAGGGLLAYRRFMH